MRHFLALLTALLLLGAGEPPLTRYEFSRTEMAMPWKLVLYASDEPTANKAAEAVFARVHELNGVFSDYDADSECSRLSRAAPMAEPVAVSADMAQVLKYALALSGQSSGAFDVTIGPLTKQWRRARRQKELPTEQDLQAARAAVGYRLIKFDERRKTVQLLKPDMRLDFGGIACGYAVDEGLAVLRKQGITWAMLDASGDIGVGDPPPGKTAWRIGVAPRDKPGGEPSRYLWLANAAVTTSGDTFQFLEINGVRYSHIVDPQTGLGLTERGSVTVVAKDCITADAVATAVAVLGPKAGLELIEKLPDAAAAFDRLSSGKAEVALSRHWMEYEAPALSEKSTPKAGN